MSSQPQLATRVLAGVSVPDTPLVNAAIAFAHKNLPKEGYHHVMRAWLNGQAIMNKLPTEEKSKIDQEAYSVAVILHDLGWSTNPDLISSDKRFEVDGAIAARSFVEKETAHSHSHHSYPAPRLQLIWDAVALHAIPDIARFKQSEVCLTSAGIASELLGPTIGSKAFGGDVITVTQEEWEGINREFPREGLKKYFKGVMVGLCQWKPQTTYGNFVGDYGDEFLEGYESKGKRLMDFLEVMDE
ncbi:hypothetical protein B0J11DRAFT_468250 [Dendryphion nanum]|uniref:HD domain-containing protein n=1 Tax=Dendryphion nanum TaxID=256645 RepID=A0A9P9DEK5_9PLEO|nr:hypothetical protein B0J11DRAFT_468250 [Dendryphion nanum]